MRRGQYMQTPQYGGFQQTLTETVPEHYGIPVETYQQVAGVMQQRYEQTEAQFEELRLVSEMDMQKIRSEFKDGADGQAILNNINMVANEAERLAENGNFHDASAQMSLRNMYRKYTTDENRLAAINAREKQIANMEAIQSSDLPQPYKDRAMFVANSKEFNRDIQNGGYVGWTPAEYVDINKTIKDYLSDWSSYTNSMSVGQYVNPATGKAVDPNNIAGNYPYLQKVIQSTSGITDQEVLGTITALIASDDKAMAWLESKYHMDNVDPETGRVKAATTMDVMRRIPVANKEGNKTLTQEERIEKASDALNGMIAERKTMYDGLGMDVDEQTILNEIHKERYLYDEMMGFVMGQGSKFIHQKTKLDYDFTKDYVYAGRLDDRNKGIAYIRELGSKMESINPNELRSSVSELRVREMELQDKLNQLDPTSEEWTFTKADLDNVAAMRNTSNKILSDLYSSINLEDALPNMGISTSVGDIGARSRLTVSDLGLDAKLLSDYIKNGNYDKVESLVFDAIGNKYPGLKNEHENPSRLSFRRESRLSERVNKFTEALFTQLNERIDHSKTNWHKNMMLITPENNMSADLLNNFKLDIQNGIGEPFVTLTGQSSADKSFRDKIKKADDVQVHYTSDLNSGDLLFHVTWLDKNKDVIHSDLVNSNQVKGVNIGTGRDLMQLSTSDQFINHPENARAILETGINIVTMYQPTYRQTSQGLIPINTLGERINSLNLQSRKPDSDGKVHSKEDPIVLVVPDADGVRRPVKLAFEKLDEDRYRLLVDYTGQGSWGNLTDKTYLNTGSMLQDIYKTLNIDR
jgi:hypothetical protein